MDRDRMADYQTMAAELRNAGIRAEVYLGNPKNFGNQLKYADKRDCPLAIIEGSDEKARGVVIVKDLVLGKRLAAEIDLERGMEGAACAAGSRRAPIWCTVVSKYIGETEKNLG